MSHDMIWPFAPIILPGVPGPGQCTALVFTHALCLDHGPHRSQSYSHSETISARLYLVTLLKITNISMIVTVPGFFPHGV